MQSGRKSRNATMTGTSPQAVPADTLVEGDHSIAVAVVAANIATAAKAEIIRRFMEIPPSNAPLYIDPASLRQICRHRA